MKIDTKDLLGLLLTKAKIVGRFRIIIFILLLVAIYGYLVTQINAASSVQPSASQQATAQVKTTHIDPELVSQLQQLQDNSVSVKALFNQARTNPFQ